MKCYCIARCDYELSYSREIVISDCCYYVRLETVEKKKMDISNLSDGLDRSILCVFVYQLRISRFSLVFL